MEPAPVASPRRLAGEELTKFAVGRMLRRLLLELLSLRLRLLEDALEE